MNDDLITEAARILKNSKSVLFITGAGISQDSGLPTYRGKGGLYNGRVTEEGIPIEEVLSGQMLKLRPEITWKYLAEIEKDCRLAAFNRAHEVIAMAEKKFARVWVLTQNIDGFHRQAGSQNVIEIHGDMHKLLCVSCGQRTYVKDYSGLTIPPRCKSCGSYLRPEVVFFGELLPEAELATLSRELKKGFDACFSVGTSSVFPYIQEPILAAKAQGKPAVEINPDRTEVSGLVDLKVPLRAKEALDRIWREYLSL